jgi:hypothetical protein
MSVPRTALVDDVTELLILMPHLGEALQRDTGQNDDAEPVSGGRAEFGLPINADVHLAMLILEREVPRLARWAAGVVAEPPIARSIGGHLQHMPRFHERMLVTAAIDDAARLAATVRAFLREVKLAVGLRTADRRLGQFCPMHDTPLRELVAPGDEGALRYKRLDRDGQPIEPVVQWDRRDYACCAFCGASWGPSQYLMLGRLLREADARRLDAAGQGAA